MTDPPTWHVYLSTACVHKQHAECRVTCKFCPAQCVCVCHKQEGGD